MKNVFLGQVLLWLFLIPATFWGQSDGTCFPKKDNQHLLYDLSGLLNANEANQLDVKLKQFAANTSNQIVVVIVDDLCQMEPAQYATELGHSWGVGQSKEDNGIVVLVKPSGGAGERRTFIAVGYGLEGAIPDITAKQIVDNELIPNFRTGQFYRGLEQATNVLMSLAQGEYNSDEYAAKNHVNPLAVLGPLLFFFLIFFLIFGIRARKYAQTNNMSFWAAILLLSASQRSHRGGWNHFSGGGGSGSGGFGGGGFGGFGGGGFGGGGAGGSW